MFTSEGKDNYDLKIIDFGYACKSDTGKGIYETLGSPLYMAPELVNN